MRKIVVIGGGHGQAAILRGIKNIPDTQISAIVTVADDGGSTGRLRRQYDMPAMGDVRNVMIALADQESLLSNLMNYRFDDPEGKGEDVAGHNLGNLILTALTSQTGSFFEAVKMIDDILNVKGEIIPSSPEVITLFARMDDGVIVKGEANIPHVDHHIDTVFYDHDVHATPEAIRAILEADLVIYGIGSVYTSILPNVIIKEVEEALARTHAYRVYFCNAMSQPGETDGYCMEDHVDALRKHGAPIDAVLFADDTIPQSNLERYAKQKSLPITIRDEKHDYEVIQRHLLDFKEDLIKHDAYSIHRAVLDLLDKR